MQKVKHIIFDFGGVFLNLNGKKSGASSQLASVFNIPVNEADKIWEENKKDLLEGKESPKDFLVKNFLQNKNEINLDEVYEKWRELHRFGKERIDWDLVEFVEILKEKYQIHMLTDAINFNYDRPDWMDKIEKNFDNIFRSFEIGRRKPDKETFLHVLEKIKAKPEECVFIDDIKANTDAAEELGIKAILFDGHIKISSDLLSKLKNHKESTENFMDWLCGNKKFLLHGSIHKISGNKIISNKGKIFASNKAAIAIMRSLYSNEGVNLQYPYFIDKDHPLMMEIHTGNGKYVKKNNGFVYIIKNEGFKNDPEGSWQFVKEANKTKFIAVVETKSKDFVYPAEVFNDFKND